MATDPFGLNAAKRDKTRAQRLRLLLVSASGTVLFVFGIYGAAYGFNAPAAFAERISTLTLQTLHDVVGTNSGIHLAATIPLGNSARRQPGNAATAYPPQNSITPEAAPTSGTIDAANTKSYATTNNSVSSSTSPVTPPGNAAEEQRRAAQDRILVSEIMAGRNGNSGDEFIELYNPSDDAVDLTGLSIRKKSSTGTESPLLAARRTEGKIVAAKSYFLAANEGGYDGTTTPDVVWAHSNTIAYKNNAIIVYDADGNIAEGVGWTEIPAGESFARISWSSSTFVISEAPTPQNLSSAPL